jgi:type I restriction-modification system DNA methylase subunit
MRSIQDIERDQHEISQNFEKLKDGQLIDLISNIGGKARADISIYGGESNDTTWRLAKMNPAIRGIDCQIAHGDTRTLDSITSTSFVKQDWERLCLV